MAQTESHPMCSLAVILRWMFAVLCLSGFTSTTAKAQPRVQLAQLVLRSESTFTAVTGAVQLPNGSILVTDPTEPAVVLVDRVGRSRVVGRPGSGPGEYREPQRLLPFRGKQALLIDPLLRRLTTFDVTGRITGSVAYPVGVAAFALEEARSVSDEGIVHFGAPVIGARPREVPVFRWQFPRGELFPVDTILGEKLVQVGAGIARIVPFSHADAVATLSDGTRVTVRATSRVVEWARPGAQVVRRPFPGIAQDIPKQVRERIRPLELQPEVERQFPPFTPGSLVVSTSDRVWVQALPARGDSLAWYGFRMGEAQPSLMMLDRASTLISVREPFAILARRMDDDTERIEVWRLR